MNKRMIIAIFILPNLRSVAAWLRMKDVNSTGGDDEAADGIDYAIDRLNKYLLEPDPQLPLPLPQS